MAQWHNGTMAQWHNGTMAQWHNGTMAQWHNRDKKGPGVKELLRCRGWETSRDELKGPDGGVGGGGGGVQAPVNIGLSS